MLTPPYAHVKLNFVIDGIKPWLNDFWFSITGTFAGGWNVQNACVAIENHFRTNTLLVMNAAVEFLGTDLLVNNAGIVATGTTYGGQSGAVANNLVPSEVAAIVRLQSAAAGRSGVGRVFISGLDSSMIDGGRLSTAGATAFATLATTFQTSVTDQGVTYHPAVYSRKNNILYNVAYCTADRPIGTQRNRRVRR